MELSDKHFGFPSRYRLKICHKTIPVFRGGGKPKSKIAVFYNL